MRYAVKDTLGGWVCSTHKSFVLAQKRADELNKDPESAPNRYQVQPSR